MPALSGGGGGGGGLGGDGDAVISVPPLPSAVMTKLLVEKLPWMPSVTWVLTLLVRTSALFEKVSLTATKPVRSIVSPNAKPLIVPAVSPAVLPPSSQCAPLSNWI